MKHVTRAVIQACAENNMNKKAASLRPFMKDEVPASPKQDKLREAFLGIPAAKRAKKENGCNTHRLTKALGDDEGVIVKKRGNWSNDEDVAILDHAAKFDGKDIDCIGLYLFYPLVCLPNAKIVTKYCLVKKEVGPKMKM